MVDGLCTRCLELQPASAGAKCGPCARALSKQLEAVRTTLARWKFGPPESDDVADEVDRAMAHMSSQSEALKLLRAEVERLTSIEGREEECPHCRYGGNSEHICTTYTEMQAEVERLKESDALSGRMVEAGTPASGNNAGLAPELDETLNVRDDTPDRRLVSDTKARAAPLTSEQENVARLMTGPDSSNSEGLLAQALATIDTLRARITELEDREKDVDGARRETFDRRSDEISRLRRQVEDLSKRPANTQETLAAKLERPRAAAQLICNEARRWLQTPSAGTDEERFAYSAISAIEGMALSILDDSDEGAELLDARMKRERESFAAELKAEIPRLRGNGKKLVELPSQEDEGRLRQLAALFIDDILHARNLIAEPKTMESALSAGLEHWKGEALKAEGTCAALRTRLGLVKAVARELHGSFGPIELRERMVDLEATLKIREDQAREAEYELSHLKGQLTVNMLRSDTVDIPRDGSSIVEHVIKRFVAVKKEKNRLLAQLDFYVSADPSEATLLERLRKAVLAAEVKKRHLPAHDGTAESTRYLGDTLVFTRDQTLELQIAIECAEEVLSENEALGRVQDGR